MRLRAVLIPAVLAASSAAADPADTIRAYKFVVRPLEFRAPEVDPFRSLVPLREIASPEAPKLRIISLRLSSVIVGRQRVAIFREANGPEQPYILVNGTLLGPDRKPVPGVAGKIEPLPTRGDYLVTLKQGAETVNFTQIWRLDDRRRSVTAAPATGPAKPAANPSSSDTPRVSQGGDAR